MICTTKNRCTTTAGASMLKSKPHKLADDGKVGGTLLSQSKLAFLAESDSEEDEAMAFKLVTNARKLAESDEFSDTQSVSEPDAEASASDVSTKCPFSADEAYILSSASESEARSSRGRFEMSLAHLAEGSDSEDEALMLEQCMATARRLAPSDSEDEPEACPSECSDSEDDDLGPVARMLRAQNASALTIPKPKDDTLEVSETSWAAKQRLRRSTSSASGSDEEMARVVKAILNKLTIERFASLFQQLVACGIETSSHMELLIDEIFEKATSQHHFIDMYADLCVNLNGHFSEQSKQDEDSAKAFRSILIKACQGAFRRNLTPPEELEKLSEEERILVETKYKTTMLGNLRLIGALLVRKMLASKILMSILDELLSRPTPEALESLAVLLSVAGAFFDVPHWSFHVALSNIFEQLQMISADAATDTRSRCLLQDLLDLRAAGWQDRKPKKLEAPTTLAEVAHKQSGEELSSSPSNWSSPKLSSTWSSWDQKQWADTVFDRDTFRAEMQNTLGELRTSHDAQDATHRLAEYAVPPEAQVGELCEWLTCVVQEASSAVRSAGFNVAANLVLEGHWCPNVMELGLQTFVQDIFPDLQYDVPTLAMILKAELYPLVQRGFRHATN